MKRFEIEGPLRGEGLIVRQAGGMHRYGHVVLSVEQAQAALSVTWEVSPTRIPEEFKAAVYRGIEAQFQPHARFGTYSTEGLLIRIVDGSSHAIDSNEGSFEIAASLALLRALDQLVQGST
ncbi:hypothetical protein IGS59_23125 [Janthinobacterium sp. GW460P]|uniref:hypothetical protein n=1 Tax=unclassified Janthinobacterium TaxID=2610881 RepID=UPI000A324330|nr:hypothetical protein [Janthinobacterium sp. GW460P]MCC7710764.1 hypothetical protein [Janthinobacterium sp. GW460W]